MNEILIYSDIGADWMGEGITAQNIKKELDALEGDISIRINSPGGDVFDGFAIYNLIKAYPGKTTVYIDGLAASAASVIAMAGDEIVMAENALMMIHDPWTMAIGSSAEMRDTADLLDKIKDSIVTTYKAKSDASAEEIGAMMAAETWFNAAEAVAKGFANSTSEKHNTVSNLDKRWIRNAPPADKIAPDTESQTMWRVALNKRRMMITD